VSNDALNDVVPISTPSRYTATVDPLYVAATMCHTPSLIGYGVVTV
jgi:hypothetical protein